MKNAWEFPDKVWVKIGYDFKFYMTRDINGDVTCVDSDDCDAVQAIQEGYIHIQAEESQRAFIYFPVCWSHHYIGRISFFANKKEKFDKFLERIYRYIELLNKTVVPVFSIHIEDMTIYRSIIGLVLPPKDKVTPHFFFFENDCLNHKIFSDKNYIEVYDKDVVFYGGFSIKKTSDDMEHVQCGQLYIDGRVVANACEEIRYDYYRYEGKFRNEAISVICREMMEMLIISTAQGKLNDDEHMVIKIDGRQRFLYGASPTSLRYICEVDDCVLNRGFMRQPFSILANNEGKEKKFPNSLTTYYPHSKLTSVSKTFDFTKDIFNPILSAVETGNELEDCVKKEDRGYIQFFGMNKEAGMPVTNLGELLLENLTANI